MTDYTHEIEEMFFTAIDPHTGEETRLHIDPMPHPITGQPHDGNRQITIANMRGPTTLRNIRFNLDQQQLGELGALFITLAGKGCDWDSAFSLLDGFDISSDSLIENAGILHGLAE